MDIRLRAALMVIQDGKMLLVPHYQTDAGVVQWTVPGGRVEFGESLYAAAVREFFEETGLRAEIMDLFDISEVILPERPYHSVTVTFMGKVTGGEIHPEAGHPYGLKMPRWFGAGELSGLCYHPAKVIEKAVQMIKSA